MKQTIKPPKRELYSKYNDAYYIRERLAPSIDKVQPNDCDVTDAEIMSGRLAPNYHGTYTKFEDGLNPLHARGVDFTQVGNILASVDAREEKVSQNIAKRRAEIEAQTKKDDSPE